MLSINTNITSLLAMTSLSKNTGTMNTALNRLSTGYRINSSKDDAAGSAISASLEKEISSFDVAQDNAQMGQSMIDVATNTLNNLQGMVQRIRDLAEESANGTYGYEERRAMQNEVNSLVDEIYRIKETTVFNGKKIFGEESSRIESPKALSEAEAIAQGYTVVKTAQELKDALVSDDPNCKVMLFSDINLNDLELDETGSNWTAVGTNLADCFEGVFDGNDFTISNLTINMPNKKQKGLFAVIHNATIENVNLDNVDIKGSSNVGGIAGFVYGNTGDKSTIKNCDVSGSIVGTNTYTGGIAGYCQTGLTVENCNVSGTISGGSTTGGIAGLTSSKTIIKNCDVSADVNGGMTGGILGYSTGTTIENCNVSSSISGTSNVGGAVGKVQSSTQIKNCNLDVEITRAGQYVGGIVGYGQQAQIENCEVSGSVEGTTYVGGIQGYMTNNRSSIIDTKTTCTVITESSDYENAGIGAVIGRKTGNATSGTISGNEYNSNINEGMPAVGKITYDLTDEQIKDNPNLVIPTKAQPQKINPIKLQVGVNSDRSSNIEIDTGFKLDDFTVNIKTEKKASQAISKIDKVMESLITKQTELGAASNRLQSTMEFQQVQKDSKIAMLSVVKDADMAKESSNFIKSQILQQTTASLLAQANQTPSIALRLLSI